MNDAPPPLLRAFSPKERQVIQRNPTPAHVQRYLNLLSYNTEPAPVGGTLRSFREVLRHRKAHCFEAALFAACVLEQHGYPPLVMDLHSSDNLDHVVYVYRQGGRWGSVGRSRNPGLHGRKPVFPSIRALAMSYFDPFIDPTGAIRRFALFDLRTVASCDWRFSPRNLWVLERTLIGHPSAPIKVARGRVRKWRVRYIKYVAAYGEKPTYYRGVEKWSPIPAEFLR